nr:integrase, catalytic region, zinc finger, CCHC-type, peptidase aspartic, catalytic [Tanacetum cinerariifolium]
MASKQFSLEPGLSNLNETGKSSNPSVSQVDEASKKDLEDLFQDFYDEYFDSSKIMKSSTTNVETSINEEVFHEVSKSFQGESSSSSLNDDVQQSPKEVILPVDPLCHPTQGGEEVIQLVFWIVDSGCSKHMTGNLLLLRNFIEKLIGTVCFGNSHFATITGYGDYVKGNLMIYSLEELNEIPSQQDLGNLFGPLYEEYFVSSTSEVSDNFATNTLDVEDTLSLSSIIVEDSDASQIVTSLEEPITQESSTPVFEIHSEEQFQKDVAKLDGNTIILSSPLGSGSWEGEGKVCSAGDLVGGTSDAIVLLNSFHDVVLALRHYKIVWIRDFYWGEKKAL